MLIGNVMNCVRNSYASQLFRGEKVVELHPDIHIIGQAAQKAGVISFTQDHVHPHDIATILDSEGIAVRAGHHCAMPLVQRFNLPAMVRVSFGIYNGLEEIDFLIECLGKTRNILK